MQILIIGGEGYIGTHLTLKFLEKGHNVVTLDSGNWCIEYKDPKFQETVGHRFDNHTRQLCKMRASALNVARLSDALKNVDMAIYLAVRHDWNSSFRYSRRLVDTNVVGLVNTLTFARKFGVPKVVFASSYDVYGNLLDARETDVLQPITMLGATKAAGEYVCRGFWEEHGLEVVILRIYNVWGKFGSHSIVDRIVVDPEYPIYGDGTNTRDFVHIDDVTQAFYSAYLWDAGIYNIGSGEETTLAGLWKLIHKGEPQFQAYPRSMNPNQLIQCHANTEFTKSQVGWEASIKLSSLKPEDIKTLSGAMPCEQ